VTRILNDEGLDQVFRNARSHTAWTEEPVSDVMLQAIYDLARFGPTSANCSPMRVLFLKSPEAKARLKPHLSPGNVEKTMTAPVTAIIGHDMAFHELLPRLFPFTDAKAWFDGAEKTAHREATAFRNGSLQGAFMIVAARALGLDCGPMSGFDPAGVDAEFFSGTQVRSNFLCNLGHGNATTLHPRAPRLEFDEACEIL